MKETQLVNILRAPHLSEKTALIAGQYVFRVARDVSKLIIKKAVEHQFKVSVKSVRVCHVKKKPVRFGRVEGQRKSWKKAYVTLAAGQQIDIGVSD